MIWPMRDARLWGHAYGTASEKHAYERHAYLHRLEKRGEPSWPPGAWSTGRLGYRVPPAAIDKYPLYLCWEETLPQALLEAWPSASPSHLPGQPTV
jgi:hypothetical protein